VAQGEDDAESDLDLLVEIPPERLRLFASSGSSAKPSTG
jgi:predicted nucleotidyltransferase